MRAAGRVPEHVGREILLSLWKIHILHHAAEHPIVGQWMMEELRAHGYVVNPGTLYPVLKRMERRGWLRSRADPAGGRRARREYVLTAKGGRVLKEVRKFLKTLMSEMASSARSTRGAQHRSRRTR